MVCVLWMSGKLHNSEFTLKIQMLELSFSLELYQASETLLVVLTKIWKYWREFFNFTKCWKKKSPLWIITYVCSLGALSGTFSRILLQQNSLPTCAFAPPSGHSQFFCVCLLLNYHVQWYMFGRLKTNFLTLCYFTFTVYKILP